MMNLAALFSVSKLLRQETFRLCPSNHRVMMTKCLE